MSSSMETLSRETLYELVWSEPVSSLSKKYGLTDVGFSKMCRRLQIPLPGRGHWARMQAGQTVRRPPLKALRANQCTNVRLRALDDQAQASLLETRRQMREARSLASNFEFPTVLTDPHPLVRATAARLKKKSAWASEKGLRSAPEEVLNVEVTGPEIDRAMLVIDALIKGIERQAGSVLVDVVGRRTVLSIGGVELSMVLAEHVSRSRHEATAKEKRVRDHYWASSERWLLGDQPRIPDYDYHPTGQLILTVGSYPNRTWRDTKRTALEQRIPEMISGIVALAASIRERDEAQARERAAVLAAQERYDSQMKLRAAERQALVKLRRDARNWMVATHLRAYVDSVEKAGGTDARAGTELELWSRWARLKADCIDPLVAVSDPILDSPEPERPRRW